MDTNTFIKRLNGVFCDSSKTEFKYSEAWLTEADFGGLYKNGKFVLNIKKNEPIVACFDEIGEVFEMLNRTFPEASSLVWSVKLYNPTDIDCPECEGEASWFVFNQEAVCA